MVFFGNINIWLFLVIIGHLLVPISPYTTESNYEATTPSDSVVSYNQPEIDPDVTWNANGITVASNSILSANPYGLFIDRNNIVYVADRASNRILIWSNNSVNPTRIISGGLSSPWSLFVTTNGDIYVDNGQSNGRVDKWVVNSNTSIPVMYVNAGCYCLFVDINNVLYCSIRDRHQVVTKSLPSSSNITTIAAGNGSSGSASNMLNGPSGIFVDINLDLYVADMFNHRIQLFRSGQVNGTTIAGYGSLNVTITLNRPESIVLDADGYFFIADSSNNRIIRSGPNGFRCLVGCSGVAGTASNQLGDPVSISFDSYGNIYAIEHYNARLQKFMLLHQTLVPSYNQPNLSSNATWNSNATTFANSSTIGTNPFPIFITTNNTIYIADRTNNRIQIWSNNSINPIKTISGGLSNPYAIFVTSNDDIYVDNGAVNGRVDKWTWNTNVSVPVMYVNGSCYGLFVDITNTLYCSLTNLHRVVKRYLNDNVTTLTIVAGTDSAGSNSTTLNNPEGIFVDVNFDLYVADFGNNRIQLFRLGQSNAITVAGNGSSTILYGPTGIVLDADKNLFIVEWNNHRIVTLGIYGFRCIVGCSGSGSSANQLLGPQIMAFDSYGNIYVTDSGNNRIQKFSLQNKSYDQTTVVPITTQIRLEQTTSMNPTTRQITQGETTSMNPTTVMITTSKQTIGNQRCFSPRVTLIPSTSSLSSPLQYRRNQDFSISSYIELNCNISLSTITQWTINNCSSSICSYQIPTNPSLTTTLPELYVPARILDYGIYQLKLTVSMSISVNLSSSSSVYIQIKPSGITANLVQLGTSMVTSGYQQDLKFDPGTYSIDPDRNLFNGSDWSYKYYCRIYGLYNFPNIGGSLLTIDDSTTIDPRNPSCLSNSSSIKYVGTDPLLKSSIIFRSGSLQTNRTYQFMVTMENLRNNLLQATGYVLVRVDNITAPVIAVGCVISTMCVANMEYQLVNPTTQVALYAQCVGTCRNIRNIIWNIYQGVMNVSTNISQWVLLNQMNTYQNIWFFGTNTSNFTATNQLFLSNPQITLWKFEVVYSFEREKSSSALNFIINQPPANGTCVITPQNGTTSTLFTLSCFDWFDADGIKDYSLYIWTTDPSKRSMIAFSSVSIFQIRLPAGDEQTSFIHLIIIIRDSLECIIEYNLSSVSVRSDSTGINSLVDSLQTPTSNSVTNNPIVQLLASGNQNTVGQVISSLSQEFNKKNSEAMTSAVASGVPAASISISPLGTKRSSSSSSSSSSPSNASVLKEFNKELNSQANIRDYLMTFTTNLAVTTSNSIKLQASTLAQLTQATNQLTRTALIIASDKCYQLSVALYEMSTKIPFEDVQTAATDLVQCATNVLSAVNGPLQQRTNVLDLDFSRSTTIPTDYDTDIESEWSNPNLFTDGNDRSREAIEKGRNLYYQKQSANQITDQMNKILSLLTSSMNIHLNLGQDLTINTPNVYMSVETISLQTLSNKNIQQVGSAQINLPSQLNSNISNNSTISLRSTVEPLAPLGNSKSSTTNTNLSTSISLSLFDQYGNEIPIQTTVDHPIEIFIPRDPNLVIPPMILQNVLNATLHNQLFNLHYTNISSTIDISVHWEIHPLNSTLAYLFIYKFDSAPILNSSMNQTDGWTLLCPSNLTNDSVYQYYVDNQKTSGHQSIIFGLRELNSTELIDYCYSNLSLNHPPITNERFNFTSNYELRIYTSGCYYLDSNNQWKSDGLLVGPLTNYDQTQCFSTHLTKFTGGFRVLPAPINWSYVFANADFMKNKTIYLTVICVCTIYIILMIYARYKDRKDLQKLGVTPLPDNHKADQYVYQIIVFTGQRKDSGTKSKVHFVLHGDNDETHVRTLADPHRSILQRGGIDAFIMTVPKSLGSLNCIRIWHDNTGKDASASWFLKYIIIRDLQTMEKFHFICQQWLAVEKDDGKIERILPVAGEMEKRQFSYILSKRAYHSVSEGHLWFSIFSRPPSNKFTRVQRCTCCFALLIVSMFLSIMYYDLQKESKMTNSTTTVNLSLGPFYISAQQIVIGIIIELLSLIPSLLIVQLFRRLRPRQKHLSPIREALYEINPALKNEMKKTTKGKSSITFPWWFIFIAYGLSAILIGISLLFIIARGIEFGDVKTQQWLTSILTGFFSSILLTQPLKILGLAIFFACFCRKTDNDEEANEYFDDNQIDFDNDEEYLHSFEKNSLFTYRPPVRIDRLNEAEVECARVQRLKEIQMWSLIREGLTYLCFLTILYLITYSNINSNAFHQVKHLRKYFLNTRQTDLDYTKISTVNDYWKWLDESFVSNLRAQKWYNDKLPLNLNGFIDDKSNRLIGWSTMRQLRIKSKLCSIKKLNSSCQYDYSYFNEDKTSYGIGWENETIIKSNSTIEQAFQYKSSNQLDTYVYIGEHGTYSGGGYVYEFRGRLIDIRSNLSELHQLSWIDNRTRAILIQLSLYNPNAQLFTSVTLLTEFLSTGGIYSQARFEPINFYIFSSVYHLILTIIYIIFIIYFMIEEIRSLIRLKWKYFRQFWSLIEIGIIICSWLAVGIYIWRYKECSRIGKLFEKTGGYSYINFQFSTYINDFLTYVYGFCCFFGTIKLIRLCRYNRRIYLFIQTLKLSGNELLSFSMMFSIVYLAFLCLFYFLFQSTLSSCATIFQTARMLFEMTLMKFDAHELTQAASVLGPLCFSLFILLVVFVCLSMFITIISDNFRQARENHKQNKEQHIYAFMFERFLRWTNLKKPSEEEIYQERDALMRAEYFDPIERFPEKIDQLLHALNRIYMDQQMEK